jgi:adenylate kinase
MERNIKELQRQAELARAALASSSISYEDAFEIVSRYTDAANVKAKEIAKQFGRKAYPIDPRGFLR